MFVEGTNLVMFCYGVHSTLFWGLNFTNSQWHWHTNSMELQSIPGAALCFQTTTMFGLVHLILQKVDLWAVSNSFLNLTEEGESGSEWGGIDYKFPGFSENTGWGGIE
jgi:hypothetical protein